MFFDAEYVNNPRLSLEVNGEVYTQQPYNFTETFSGPNVPKCRVFAVSVLVRNRRHFDIHPCFLLFLSRTLRTKTSPSRRFYVSLATCWTRRQKYFAPVARCETRRWTSFTSRKCHSPPNAALTRFAKRISKWKRLSPMIRSKCILKATRAPGVIKSLFWKLFCDRLEKSRRVPSERDESRRAFVRHTSRPVPASQHNFGTTGQRPVQVGINW